MTDGIVGIYLLSDVKTTPGGMPKKGLTLIERFFFEYDTLGISRYYTALQANQTIDAVINIPGWNPYPAGKYVAILADENGELSAQPQYTVQMVQTMLDDNGLRFTKLSLERIGENYVILS